SRCRGVGARPPEASVGGEEPPTRLTASPGLLGLAGDSRAGSQSRRRGSCEAVTGGTFITIRISGGGAHPAARRLRSRASLTIGTFGRHSGRLRRRPSGGRPEGFRHRAGGEAEVGQLVAEGA